MWSGGWERSWSAGTMWAHQHLHHVHNTCSNSSRQTSIMSFIKQRGLFCGTLFPSPWRVMADCDYDDIWCFPVSQSCADPGPDWEAKHSDDPGRRFGVEWCNKDFLYLSQNQYGLSSHCCSSGSLAQPHRHRSPPSSSSQVSLFLCGYKVDISHMLTLLKCWWLFTHILSGINNW